MLVPIVPSAEITAPAKQGSPHHWQFSKAHDGPRIAQGFQYSVHSRLYNKIMQATKQKSYKLMQMLICAI
jgi:hypothetical protein